MGIEERKKRDALKMRQRILGAAMDLFTQGGYGAVSMRGIAEMIEYSPATLYRYFKNKDDIMLQLCFQGFEKLLARQMELDRIADPAERLRVGGARYIDFARENPELYELMFSTKEIIKKSEGPEESVALKSFYKFVEHVRQWGKEGFFPEKGAEVVTVGLWAALHGLASLLINEQLRFLPPERVDFIIKGALAFNLRHGGAKVRKEDRRKQ